MNKKLILVTGYMASGKSTFVRRLSKEVNVPYLMKDTFKIALCQSLTIANREESSQFSAVTFDGMMYVAQRLFETGSPLILEGNFVPAGVKKVDEAGTIRQLAGRYGYETLTFKFTGDPRILHERFVQREQTDERGAANKIGEEVPFATFDGWCHALDSFDIGGRTVRVDTTDFAKTDFDGCIELAQKFLE